MHFRLLITILLLFPFRFLYGQNEIDSLTQLLNTKNDSLRIAVINQLSKAYNHIDPERSLKLAQEGEQLARNIGNAQLIADLINSKGVAYYYLNELDLSNGGYFTALNIFDSIGDNRGVARALNNIAWNFKIQSSFEKAVDYFHKSLEISKKINDLELQQATLNNLGTVYRHTNRLDSALVVYEQSLDINRQLKNIKWEVYNLNNIGLVYLDKKQFQTALNYFDKAMKMNIEYGFTQEVARNIMNIGMVYIETENYKVAEQYLDQADSIINAHDFKREKLEYLDYRIILYESSGDFRNALSMQREYNKLDKELNQAAFDERVSELQTKFNLAQKTRELEASERKLVEQRFVILVVSGLFILLLGILFLVIKLYQSKNLWGKNVEKLNDEINLKNEELQSMNREIQEINNNLEETVRERTEKLLVQNEKLLKYAFINSHEIRGPLARVLGLLYLIKLENKSIQGETSFKLLDEATNELDSVIKQTSKLLEDEEIYIEDNNL